MCALPACANARSRRPPSTRSATGALCGNVVGQLACEPAAIDAGLRVVIGVAFPSVPDVLFAASAFNGGRIRTSIRRKPTTARLP